MREDDLITQGKFFDNGAARVLSGSGLGIDLDQAAIKKNKTGQVMTSTI